MGRLYSDLGVGCATRNNEGPASARIARGAAHSVGPAKKKPAKRKADESKGVTEDAIKLRKVMKLGQDIVDKHNKAVRKVQTTGLRLSKCETSHKTNQETLVKEIKKLRKERKNVKKKSTKALKGVMQHVETFVGLIKKDQPVAFDTTKSFFGSLMKKDKDDKEAAESDGTSGAKVFKKARAVLDANGSDSDSDGDDDIIEGTVEFPMNYDAIDAPAHYKESNTFNKLQDFEDQFSDVDEDDDDDEDDKEEEDDN